MIRGGLVGVLAGLALNSWVMPAHGSNNGSEGTNTTLVSYNLDDIHAVYITASVSSIMGVKIRDVMRVVYDPTDLRMYQTTEFVLERNDVRVYEANYGDSRYVGRVSCDISASTSYGAHPTYGCIPVRVRFNEFYADVYDTDPERWAIACEELGHTVALRHGPDHIGSCVTRRGVSNISAEEIDHINRRH